jgi:hypothetical protein
LDSCVFIFLLPRIFRDHLSHLYSDTGNITQIFEVCKQYLGLEQRVHTMDEYYSQVMAICKERNMYQPLSIDLKTVEKQCQDVDVVGFFLA